MAKFLVTDPCYISSCIDGIISDDDWSNFCKVLNEKGVEEARKFMCELTGLNILMLDYTDYGDWQNYLEEKSLKVKVISAGFMADAGLFCVIEQDAKLRKLIKEKTNRIWGSLTCSSAVFETKIKTSELEFRVDHSGDRWAVLQVVEKSTGSLLVTSSEEGEDEYITLWK